MIFIDRSKVRSSTLTRSIPAPLSALAVATVLVTLSACSSMQFDASQATDGYWDKVKTRGISVGNGGTAGNLVLQPAIQKASPGKTELRALAESSVRPDNPGTYTVSDGDTLWDISEKFLNRPWLWPEIWHVNPQIGNPHLIYPGDRISITYVDGKPRLQLERGPVQTIEAASRPIEGFPTEAIRAFLVKPRVVTSEQLRRSPYIVSAEDDRLISALGHHIYVRGTAADGNSSRYNVYRPGKALVDPDTNEELGYEAIRVSTARMVRAGDPSTLKITANKRETLVGDRLMQTAEPNIPENIVPRASLVKSPGKIISMFDAITRSGQNQVVVLNRGTEDGVQIGDVMAVTSNDRKVRDKISGVKNDWVTIPGEQSGVVLVFRTFGRVSYALIMEADRAIKIYDRVASAD